MYSIAEAKRAIKNGINTYLLKDETGRYVMQEVNCLPFYLEGAPGIGKTEIVRQIAAEMGLGFVSFSLVHHTRNSLLGLPVIRELEDGDKYTSYTMSEIIAKVLEAGEAGYKEGILLLDEFNCMSESIMPAMLAFLQNKNIGGHALPRGWVLILCGNPVEYNRSARTFDAAVTDRIRKLEVNYTVADFLAYGREKGFNECVLSYLKVHTDHLYRYSRVKGNEELVTCRSWENLSHALTLYEKLNQKVETAFVREFLKSVDVADCFTEYYKQNICGINEKEREKILNGKPTQAIVRKIKDMTFDLKWNVLEGLLATLTTALKNTGVRGTTIACKITNLFDFALQIGDEGVLRERLYIAINNDETLLNVVSKNTCEPYAKMCRESLGIKKMS